MKKLQVTPQTLTQLYQLINNGQAARALPYLQQLATHNQRDTNVLHLSGLAYASLADHEQAKTCFTRALEINFHQPEVHNNFANFLKSIGDNSQARLHYRHAIEIAPTFQDAWRNLAILEYELGELGPALEHASKALELASDNPVILTLLGNIYRKNDQPEVALQYFDRALTLKPEHVTAIYGKALTCSTLELSDEALPLLERALYLRPDSADIQYARALALLNLGDYEQAEGSLKGLLAKQPLYLDAHRTLNEIYWQQSKQAAFGESYRQIPTPQRSEIPVAIAQVEDLLAAKRPEEAAQRLDSGWKGSTDPRITFLRGRIAEEHGNVGQALTLYERAFAGYPDLSVAKQFFIALIRTGQFERCEAQIADYLERAPEDQLLWALRGTCWKMLGDERYHWLTRENEFVQSFEIPTPAGYGSRSEFLTELRASLLRMHNLKTQPLNQSVRAGVQTPGRLLYKRDPVIQALRESLSKVVGEYIAAMPKDTTHPLLRRKWADFRFSGSWSVLLRGGGHHVSHVHPQGWISSAFYVSAPPRVKSDEVQGGDIYFGQSPYQLGDADNIEKNLTPEPGKLVLFPSFTWHGTIPLPEAENQERITTPFDAVPAKG